MKTSKHICLFFLLGVLNTADGQSWNKHLEKVVSEYVFELNSQGIDTVIIYQEYGGNGILKSRNDSCEFGNTLPVTLFWVKNGQSFMTMKHDCFDYSVIGLKNRGFAKFLDENLVKFQNEEINTDFFITHSTNQFIRIIIKQHLVLEKELKDYYFIKETPSKEINSHYEFNINVAIKKFQIMISNELIIIGQEKIIEKTRR